MESELTYRDMTPTRHDSIGAECSVPSHKSKSRHSFSPPDMNNQNARYYQYNPVPNSATPSRPPSVSGKAPPESSPVVSALKKVLEICCCPFVACFHIPYTFGYMIYREKRYGDMGEVYMNGYGEKERRKEEKKRQQTEEKIEKQRRKAEMKEPKRKN